jgi:hypothetical protein
MYYKNLQKLSAGKCAALPSGDISNNGVGILNIFCLLLHLQDAQSLCEAPVRPEGRRKGVGNEILKQQT